MENTSKKTTTNTEIKPNCDKKWLPGSENSQRRSQIVFNKYTRSHFSNSEDGHFPDQENIRQFFLLENMHKLLLK